MTLIYMEGFESVAQSPDFTARGAAVSVNGVVSTQAARYAGGKCAIRTATGTASAALVQRPIGPMGLNGLAGTFFGRLTAYNQGVNRYRVGSGGGNFISAADPLSSNHSAISFTSDYLRWPNPITIMNNSRIATDAIYDASRSQYLVVAYTLNGSNDQSFLTSATLPNAGGWANQDVAGSPSSSSAGARLYQGSDNSLVCVGSKSVRYRLPGAATVWSAGFNITTASPTLSGAAHDGTKWYVSVSDANTLYTSPTGQTWTPATIANASAYSIAAKPGVVVLGRSGAQPFSTSLDGGATFTPVTISPAPTGVMLVAYGNGTFVAFSNAAAEQQVYTSTDGLNWTSTLMSRFGACTNLNFSNGRFFAVFNNVYMASSADGLTWDWNENGVATAANNGSLLGFQSPAVTSLLFGFNMTNTGRLYGIYPTGLGTTGNVDLGAKSLDTWYNMEAVLTRDAPTQYSITLNVDGVPAFSSSVTYALMANTGKRSLASMMYNANYSGGSNGSKTILPTVTADTVQVTFDNGMSYSTLVIPGLGAPTRIRWTGTRWLAFGMSGFYNSLDGVSWTRAASGPSSIGNVDVEVNGNTVIVVGNTTTNNVWRSTDGGLTWASSTVGSIGLLTVSYVNGAWILGPNSASATNWYYSINGGVVWNTFPHTLGAYTTAAKATNSVAALVATSGGINRLSYTGSGTPTITLIASGVLPAAIGCTNSYFFVTDGSLRYSADGITWVSLGVPSGVSPLYNTGTPNYVIVHTSGSNLNSMAIFPELADIPLAFTWQQGTFSAVDDVAVTNFVQPNAGPQGAVVIMQMPSDTDVQAEWTKHPDTVPTNAAAGARTPLSRSANYFVDSSTVGTKDKYGTSAFTFPSGLRPIALQVEAMYERVFTNVPQVKLGLASGASEVQTNSIPITMAIGTSSYVSKIVEQNPDGGGGWTRENINGTSVTNQKTA